MYKSQNGMTLIIISQPITPTMLNMVIPSLHLLGHNLEAHLVGKADVIHSNGGLKPVAVSSVPRLGALQQLGHLDFYPGEGTVQQGCKFEVL